MNLRTRLFLMALVVLPACDDHKTWAPEIMDPATGATRSLSSTDVTGKTILVNYWAAWCKPCLEEIPELNRFAAEHAADVMVLAMNFDQPERKHQQAAAQQAGIQYFLLMTDPAPTLGLPHIEGLPMTFIVNDRGELKQTLAGQQTLASLQAVLPTP